MRVLVAHNRYRSALPSGENAVVADEIQLLRRTGTEVVELIESSDDIDLRSPGQLAKTLGGPVFAVDGVRKFDQLLERHRVDLVHLHNVFPLISPWVVRRARSAGIPVVMTVHNFRLDCVSGSYFRDDRLCTDCSGTRLALPAVRHGCYRASRLQTVPMAVGRAVHAATWKMVSRFIALTDFHADFLCRLGVPADRVVVRPTAAPDPGPMPPPGDDLLFVGRLDDGKGVAMLVDAWRRRRNRYPRRLRIAGTGPLLTALQGTSAPDADIEFLGALGPEEVSAAIARAAAVAVPSRLFEGFPRVVAEAFAHGRPVLATDRGGLASVVDDAVGWRVAGGTDQWAQAIDALDPATVVERGAAARDRYLAELTPELSQRSLLRVYAELCPTAA